jgi:hypothetical protein
MAALLVAGAFFISNAPLETSRPALAEPQLKRSGAAQDVDARLWQDPFGAVAKAREQTLDEPDGLKADIALHDEQAFSDELRRLAMLAGRGGGVVLAVMMSGGPYAEQVESRRRTRYAVLSGLKARGFVPTDNEHLGYFLPFGGEGVRNGLPKVVPFERLDAEPDARDRCNGCRLVVLWLDSSAFHDRPLEKLATLARRVVPDDTSEGEAAKLRWRVLGPSSSDGLRALVDEAAAPAFDPNEQRASSTLNTLKSLDLRFFSAAATAPDAALLRNAKAPAETSVSAYLATRGVSLLRTIGTDDRLARAMVNELELRGLQTRPPNGRIVKCPDGESDAGATPQDLPSSIAIVSEGDTLYGRTLRQQFRYDPASGRPGFCVTRWHYFRGLDGRLPGDPAPQGSDGRTKSDARAESTQTGGRDGTYSERPEGPSQFDYLRRLATRIREEDAALRKVHGREYGIRAVGVLGNDVYDKLLVLQALLPEMPHAIFFTTDLDARLFHPREQAWARNLIVASNLGLRLSDPLQRDIAPFRDSYQTSAYLGTLLLMADVGDAIAKGANGPPRWKQSQISAWFEKPRLFEVSRAGVFDFSESVDAARRAATPATLSAGPPRGAGGPTPAPGERPLRCGRGSLEACIDIHPDASPMAPELTFAARFLIFGALIGALWVPALALSRGARRWLRRYSAAGRAQGRPLRVGALAAGFAVLAVGLPWLLALAWPPLAEAMTRDGKPLSFTEGISPWPTYAIRLATFVLCGYLVVRAWSSLASNANRIAREFRLGATRRHFMTELDAEQGQLTLWPRLMSMLSVRFYPERAGLPGRGPPTMSPTAQTFWKHYLVQNRAKARLLRTLLCMVVMIGLSVLIERAIGDAPIAPQRGDLTRTMQTLSTLPAALAVLFLIFFVVDATALCVFFLRGLRLHHANWPERTLQAFHLRTSVPAEYLDDWIDLEFIARRTRCVGALIYYPFVVLSLMLLARSSFFDDWYTPPSFTVLSMLSFAIVLTCALALRRSAEASRTQALDRLRDAILRAKGASNGALVSQLEALRDRIERLREGAFAPYSQQPLLKAVLLPFLTFGGSSLFDYLTLANL